MESAGEERETFYPNMDVEVKVDAHAACVPENQQDRRGYLMRTKVEHQFAPVKSLKGDCMKPEQSPGILMLATAIVYEVEERQRKAEQNIERGSYCWQQ